MTVRGGGGGGDLSLSNIIMTLFQVSEIVWGSPIYITYFVRVDCIPEKNIII